MEHVILPSLILAIIFSWEEIKGLCFKLFALSFHAKPKYVSKNYLDQFVADLAFIATIPVGLMIVIAGSKNFSQTLLNLSLELAVIFIFIEAARFVSRHTRIFAADSWSESIVATLVLVPKIYPPFRLARFYRYKFEFGSKFILEIFGCVALSLLAIIAMKNFSPEIVRENLTALIVIFTALTFSIVTLDHLHIRLHRSSHPFWTNFRLLAGILVSVALMLR